MSEQVRPLGVPPIRCHGTWWGTGQSVHIEDEWFEDMVRALAVGCVPISVDRDTVEALAMLFRRLRWKEQWDMLHEAAMEWCGISPPSSFPPWPEWRDGWQKALARKEAEVKKEEEAEKQG